MRDSGKVVLNWGLVTGRFTEFVATHDLRNVTEHFSSEACWWRESDNWINAHCDTQLVDSGRVTVMTSIATRVALKCIVGGCGWSNAKITLDCAKRLSGLQSNNQSSCTSVYTGLHQHTLLTSFVRWQMLRLVSDSVPVHLHHWLSAAPDSLLSVTELSRSPLHVSGTVCQSCNFRTFCSSLLVPA